MQLEPMNYPPKNTHVEAVVDAGYTVLRGALSPVQVRYWQAVFDRLRSRPGAAEREPWQFTNLCEEEPEAGLRFVTDPAVFEILESI